VVPIRDGALNTIAGYEVMNMICKGQICWAPKGDTVGQMRFIERALGLAASPQFIRASILTFTYFATHPPEVDSDKTVAGLRCA